MTYTLEQIETALDAGRLYVRAPSMSQARRNGATKRWKRDPSWFRLPIKYGFRGTHAITESDLNAAWLVIDSA